MDERELVGLLYRADWTRLSLSGTVRGVNTGLHSIVTETLAAGSGQSWAPPLGGEPDTERTLLVAPGKRYREDSADGSYAGGCDGERIWQWYADMAPTMSLKFDDRPRPPFPTLLAPSWLLTGYELALEGEVTVCGRSCVRVRATPRKHGAAGGRNRRGVGIIPVPFGFDAAVEPWDAVEVVVDAELGIALRCSRRHGTALAEVTEFLSLTAGGEADADPGRFSPPEGSIRAESERERGQRRPPVGGLGESLTESLGAFGREIQENAAKAAAGLVAGGLGAVLKVAWSPPKDPFARATAEESDSEALIPRDEQAPPASPGPAEAAAPPVSDELLHLLYRSGAAAPRLTATLHDWLDVGALFEAIPESARGAGFGGVGFLVDTLLSKARDNGLDDGHEVRRLRIDGWDRYQIDTVLPLRWVEPEGPEASGDDPTRHQRGPLYRRTLAGDGTQTWEVYADRVVTGPPEPLPSEFVDLLDTSWLLTYELSGAEEVSVDGGRRGYRVVVRKPEPLPAEMNPWLNPGTANMIGLWAQLFFPAVAVVDAESGRLVRLTRYKGGQPVLRDELRDIADLEDNRFTPPAGLPMIEKSDDRPPVTKGAARVAAAAAAAGAVKKQVDETVAAARGFIESFLHHS